MIADQLGLKVSTVANFFMNARRRSTEKYCDDGDEPPAAAAASGPLPAATALPAETNAVDTGTDWKPTQLTAGAAGTPGMGNANGLRAISCQLPSML